MKSSGVSLRSDLLAVAVCLILLAAVSVGYFASHGYVLYYGDAQAHLNISRSIFDSRTPGPDQVGSVWLPVLHVICIPLVGIDALWSSGLAGSLPVALFLVAAGLFLYLTAREVYAAPLSGAVALLCFVLNPNILYLGSIPMTEVVFLAELSLFLYSFAKYRSSNRKIYLAAALIASWLMSLTRYDGWFLLPFEAIWLAAVTRRWRISVLFIFGLLACLAPLAWIAHNWYWTGNALDFYNGPYSAKAIQGNRPYPGFRDWPVAALYFADAAELCSGWGLTVVGLLGLVCALLRKQSRWPAVFLLLTPLFYVWSIHSSGNPIHVPNLYPFSYYNTRYGVIAVLLFAFCAGALADRLSASRRKWALGTPLIAILPWMLQPGPEHWICWKESQVNSVARRAWTARAASYLRDHYRAGEGILTDFGDSTGIYCRARIPLKQTLHIGNNQQWYATTTRPDLSHPTSWAIAPEGDSLYHDLTRSGGRTYEPVFQISVPGAPPLQIFTRRLTQRSQ